MPIMFLQSKMNMEYVIKTLTLVYKISSTLHNDIIKDVFDNQQDSLPSLSPQPKPSQSHSTAPRAEGAPGLELEEQRSSGHTSARGSAVLQ